MSETNLIERVAKLAGWERIGNYLPRYAKQDDKNTTMMAWPDELDADGLVFLLKELIEAGKEIGMFKNILGTYTFTVEPDYAESAPTLDEAVMLAYVAMKEGER